MKFSMKVPEGEWADMCRFFEGRPVLLEHEAARWPGKDELDSADRLPADITIIDMIREKL